MVSGDLARRMEVQSKDSPIPSVCEAEIFTVAIIIPEKSKNNLTPRLREYRKPVLHVDAAIILQMFAHDPAALSRKTAKLRYFQIESK